MKHAERPALTQTISVTDFLAYYWLKAELVDFCQQHHLQTGGGKLIIRERIVQFLQTGQPPPPQSHSKRAVATPAEIHLDAILTENYTNNERVRQFFKTAIGPHFRFTVGQMNFCRENSTGTFRDAVHYWLDEQARKKSKLHPSEIAPQFEYNQYIRDFMAHNPNTPLAVAIDCWKRKKGQPGGNKYSSNDLILNP